MGLLTYCILKSEPGRRAPELSGVGHQQVNVVKTNGLGAAVSRLNRDEPPLEIPELLRYQKVIDAFFQDRTIIPMRYGCFLENEHRVVSFLEERLDSYMALLKELDGCVEMGIRILISDFGFRISENRDTKPIKSHVKSMSGIAYLNERKSYYGEKDSIDKNIESIIDNYRNLFDGLHVKMKAENSKPENSAFRIPLSAFNNVQNHPLSLYFLVPRKFIEPFRQVFRDIESRWNIRMLLSGPWPPFNFVSECHSQGRNSLNF